MYVPASDKDCANGASFDTKLSVRMSDAYARLMQLLALNVPARGNPAPSRTMNSNETS